METVAMTEDLGVRVAVLEADHKSHARSDDERYDRIEANSSQTMTMITELGRKIDSGFGRAHERIDAAHTRISNLKLWFLSGAVTVLFGALVFFIVPFFSRG